MKKFCSIISFSLLISLFSCSDNAGNAKADGKDSVSVHVSTPMSPEEMEMKEMMERQKNEAPKENPYKDAKIDVKVFESKDPNLKGFGYDIYIFDALYVHQPHIPAINGNRGFKTKEQAQRAAEFVAHKIRNNIMPPSLSVEELDSLGTLK